MTTMTQGPARPKDSDAGIDPDTQQLTKALGLLQSAFANLSSGDTVRSLEIRSSFAASALEIIGSLAEKVDVSQAVRESALGVANGPLVRGAIDVANRAIVAEARRGQCDVILQDVFLRWANIAVVAESIMFKCRQIKFGSGHQTQANWWEE